MRSKTLAIIIIFLLVIVANAFAKWDYDFEIGHWWYVDNENNKTQFTFYGEDWGNTYYKKWESSDGRTGIWAVYTDGGITLKYVDWKRGKTETTGLFISGIAQTSMDNGLLKVYIKGDGPLKGKSWRFRKKRTIEGQWIYIKSRGMPTIINFYQDGRWDSNKPIGSSVIKRGIWKYNGDRINITSIDYATWDEQTAIEGFVKFSWPKMVVQDQNQSHYFKNLNLFTPESPKAG